MNVINIAICDDEIYVTNKINELITTLCQKHNYIVSIDIFYNVTKLTDFIKQGKHYDIIYLDIQMNGLDGIETAEIIRKYDVSTLIIFITNYDNYAKKAFEVAAFRFIDKPIEKELFEKYLLSAIEKLNTTTVYFEYQYNKVCYKLPIREIMYFQSEKRSTFIITKNNVSNVIRKYYEKLSDIEKRLSQNGISFLYPNQSFLVNPMYVEKFYLDLLILCDGSNISISRRKRNEVKTKYFDYIDTVAYKI